MKNYIPGPFAALPAKLKIRDPFGCNEKISHEDLIKQIEEELAHLLQSKNKNHRVGDVIESVLAEKFWQTERILKLLKSVDRMK